MWPNHTHAQILSDFSDGFSLGLDSGESPEISPQNKNRRYFYGTKSKGYGSSVHASRKYSLTVVNNLPASEEHSTPRMTKERTDSGTPKEPTTDSNTPRMTKETTNSSTPRTTKERIDSSTPRAINECTTQRTTKETTNSSTPRTTKERTDSRAINECTTQRTTKETTNSSTPRTRTDSSTPRAVNERTTQRTTKETTNSNTPRMTKERTDSSTPRRPPKETNRNRLASSIVNCLPSTSSSSEPIYEAIAEVPPIDSPQNSKFSIIILLANTHRIPLSGGLVM